MQNRRRKSAVLQLNPPGRVEEIIFDDEIPFGDEIRPDAGWVDLISSAQQISPLRSKDFVNNLIICFTLCASTELQVVSRVMRKFNFGIW